MGRVGRGLVALNRGSVKVKGLRASDTSGTDFRIYELIFGAVLSLYFAVGI